MENQTKIPNFESLEEMAQFWDVHDITDFEDELVEVKEPVFVKIQAPEIQRNQL